MLLATSVTSDVLTVTWVTVLQEAVTRVSVRVSKLIWVVVWVTVACDCLPGSDVEEARLGKANRESWCRGFPVLFAVQRGHYL